MSDRRWLLMLVLLAVLARAGAVVVLRSHEVPRSTFEHGEIAENLLAGRGFSVKFLGGDGLTSQQAPLYPFLLAGAYAIGGVGTPRSLLIFELGQSLLGGLLVLGVAELARQVAPGKKWVERGACLIAAVHPTLVYAATHVQVALLAAMTLTWALAVGARAARTGSLRDGWLAGVWLALAALTDPILGIAGPAIVVGVVRSLSVGRSARLAWRMGLACLLGVSPWVVRNAAAHGEFVPIKSSFGYAFWQGNCALSEGTDKVVRASVEKALSADAGNLADWNKSLWKARHEAGYIDDIALTRDDYKALGALNEPGRSRLLFRRALADLSRDPSRYVLLTARRLRYFVLFDETNPKTRSLFYRIPHLGLTVLAALGLCLTTRECRRAMVPTFLTVGAIAAFHSLTIVSARFHIPIEPVLGLWAASGLARWGTRGASKFRAESIAEPARQEMPIPVGV